MKEDIRLLKIEECFGNDKLDMFKKGKVQADVTDFALLLGAYCNIDEDGYLEKTAPFFTMSSKDHMVRVVNAYGVKSLDFPNNYIFGFRPVIDTSVRELLGNVKVKNNNGTMLVQYGYYPQKAASAFMQKELNNNKGVDTLATHRVFYPENRMEESVDDLHVYYYKGKKFVKVVATYAQPIYEAVLSNGVKYKRGDTVWVELNPINWLYDLNKDVLVSEKILSAGLEFDDSGIDLTDFKNTKMKKYIDGYFTPEIKRFNVGYSNNNINEFDLKNVSEEDIIKGCILSDIPVFLHGQTGEGKSSRVRELDPNLQVIYLQTMTPESLNGRNVYNESTGESIDKEPTWYKKLCERCESEPDKLHIVFFDELTNATHILQGMIYNIVLDREVNGIWKLPSNARIVGAGNEKDESLSANEFSVPLFSRFAHVYIDTSPETFLRWGNTPREKYKTLENEPKKLERKIHPYIYGYIAYKENDGGVLRTAYNGVTPNADPRKWEMASKILYKTGKPSMLRSLVGEELTNDFISFINQNTYSLEDIINKKYKKDNIKLLDDSVKYHEAVYFSNVSEEDFEAVREYISLFGSRIEKVFCTLWYQNHKENIQSEEIKNSLHLRLKQL